MLIEIPCTIECTQGGCKAVTKAVIKPRQRYEHQGDYGGRHTDEFYFTDEEIEFEKEGWQKFTEPGGMISALCPKHRV